ncbi:MAG: hypothetical protein AB8F34_03180 [Akkermansiaceae bacterium]
MSTTFDVVPEAQPQFNDCKKGSLASKKKLLPEEKVGLAILPAYQATYGGEASEQVR